MFRKILCGFMLSYCIVANMPSYGQGNVPPETRCVSCSYWMPYCGLYCIFAAAKYQHIPMAFEDLLTPTYISSFRGSNFEELRQAALDHGMNAVLIGNISTDTLLHLEYPMILHFRSRDRVESFDHFILFLGTENGRIKVFDPPDKILKLTEAELLSRWDGNGLILSRQPIDQTTVLLATLRRPVMISMITVAAIILLRFLRKRLKRPKTRHSIRKIVLMSGATCILILLLGTSLGYGYNLLRSDGLLYDRKVLRHFEKVNIGNIIPRVRVSQIEQWKANGALLIDARYRADYKAGHIPGAINIPINVDSSQWKKILAQTPFETRIIVYCESQGCKFAEEIAVKLYQEGYRNVAIYTGGWRDWHERSEGAQ